VLREWAFAFPAFILPEGDVIGGPAFMDLNSPMVFINSYMMVKGDNG